MATVAIASIAAAIGPAPFVAAASGVGGATQDTQPPLAPNNFRIESRSAGSMYLAWDWATDQGGGFVARYELKYLGKTVLVNHYYPGESISLTGFNLQPGSTYPIELWAIDDSGNRALSPARLTFETTPPGAASDLRLVGMQQDYPDVIAFTPAPDNSTKIWGYHIYLDSEFIGTTRAVNRVGIFDFVYYIACIDPHGPVDIQLRAIDSSHNVSQHLSAPLRVVFP
jgi:hypothetical protein